MTTPLFDKYIAIDWSAANTPKRGGDSIWLATAYRATSRIIVKPPENLPTRAAAMSRLKDLLGHNLKNARRTLVGLDFPFGYPQGSIGLITGTRAGTMPPWRKLWSFLFEHVEDDDTNRSNRFDLADQINSECFGEAVYWGRPRQKYFNCLPEKKEVGAVHQKHEFRRVERVQPPAKSVWQLAYTGAVGSQALLGIARLEALRRDPVFRPHLAIWPFETAFQEKLDRPILLAEIYPSMFKTQAKADEVRDAAQVRTVAHALARADRTHQGARNMLQDWLSPPPHLAKRDLKAIVEEEGWIVGAGRV
ncbi:MAG: hypothetical protein EVA70_01730 [Parvularculaceae bacterium]|nr:MAG: hypothetical protein EVA70_01730 [Parvularculaceae bacterium]